MSHVDPVKIQRFCNSFRAATEDIFKVFSSNRAASSNGH